MKSIAIERHDAGHGVVRLAVTGEVGSSTSDLVAVTIRNAIFGGSFQLVVDLSRVNHFDFHGVDAVVAGRSLALEYGIDYRIVNGIHTDRFHGTGVQVRPAAGHRVTRC